MSPALRDLEDDEDEGPSLAEWLAPLLRRWYVLAACGLLAGIAGVGVAFTIKPTFTARATFLSPQSASPANQALASLGGLANLAGGAAARTPADQYATLMQSATVADRLIDQFRLLEVYEVKMRTDARRRLADNTRISVGKRDGLITVDVDDHDPARAAAVANRYIEELRTMSARFALSEAQQRRVFFEGLLKATRAELLKAQLALESSGFNQGALRAEPRAAAETYARLRAEVSAAEVRLQTLRNALTDGAPEVQRGQAQLEALRVQLSRVEQADSGTAKSDYLARFREFKYQETLFDLFARQFEAARVDEAREGMVIQVVDAATPPERKSKPKRAYIALGAACTGVLLAALVILVRHRPRAHPAAA